MLVFLRKIENKRYGSVVDHLICIEPTMGLMTEVEPLMNHLLIDVGVKGVSSMWKHVFLSSAADHEVPVHICAGRWKAVNLTTTSEPHHCGVATGYVTYTMDENRRLHLP